MTHCRWCKAEPAPNRKLCARHLAANAQARARYRDRLVAAGLCSSCGCLPAPPGRKTCAACIADAAVRKADCLARKDGVAA